MNIAQLMTRHVVTCGADDTLERAAQLMWDFDCGAVPVVDGERHVIGIITDRDVCMSAYTQGRPLKSIKVHEAMANEVFSCMPDDSIAEAEKIMRNYRIRRLPVIDFDGRLVGMVSLNDLARESVREQSQRRRDVTLAEVGATLAAICEPRSPAVLPLQD
jgi:CBS domain-containing protein